MKGGRGSAARTVALATLALLVVAALVPGRFELALRIYALVLAGVTIVLALLALRRAFPPGRALDLAGPAPRRPTRPPSLARVENEVVLGIASSFDLHFRLVPRLRTIAEGILASRRSVSLTADPHDARALLGDEAWELVRPERPAPRDRMTRGIEPRDLERVVEGLEGV